MHFDEDMLEWLEEEEVEEERVQPHLPQGGCLAEDIERACSDGQEHASWSKRDAWRFYSLIYVMAVLTCLLSFLNDIMIELGFNLRGGLLRVVVHRFESAPAAVLEVASMITWVGYEVVVVGLAHLCARKYPMSYGSGIPEVHCELQGTHMKGFLAPGMLRAKALGLTLAEMGGLPIGKEGPFVHLAAAITRFLAHLPFFEGALHIPGCLRQLMVVSVAVGTCSTVGVPIGGVLFALEVMPDSVWENMSYWMSIGTATMGGLTLFLLKVVFKDIIVSLVPELPSQAGDASLLERPFLANCMLLSLSALLGLVCGALGAVFVSSQIGLQSRLRNWIAGVTPGGGPGVQGTTPKGSSPRIIYAKAHTLTCQEPLVEKPFRVAASQPPRQSAWQTGDRQLSRRRALGLCLLVAAADGLVSFTVPMVRGSSQPALLWKLVASNHVEWASVNNENVPSLPHDSIFSQVPTGFLLAVFFVLKWVMTTLALSLPLPTGCIIPSYVLGAVIGRCYAYAIDPLLRLVFHDDTALYVHVQFSFIGATAFTCAICHSFSVVVVMFELVNAKEDVLLRLGTAAIVAIYTANMISPSIFQASATMKRLPQTHQSNALDDGWEPVTEAMRLEVPVVPEVFGSAKARREVLVTALDKFAYAAQFVVLAGGPQPSSSPAILGCVERAAVEAALLRDEEAFAREELEIAPQVPPTMPMKHAQLALELMGNSELYIVEQGRLVGAVTFNDIVYHQRAKRKRA